MVLRLLLLGVCLAVPASFAQSVPDWAAPPASPNTVSEAPADADAVPPPPPIPVDGGLALLALAGAGLAARRLRSA